MSTAGMTPAPGRGATEFTTADPERAHAFLCATYVDHTVRIRGNRDNFRMRHTGHALGEFSVAVFSHTMAVEYRCQPLGFLLLGRVLAGRLQRASGENTMRLSPGDLFLFASPDEPFSVRREAIELQLIRINLSALDRLDRIPPAPRFTDLRPISPGAARQLTVTLDWITDELLTNSEAAAQPLITSAAARILAGTVLATFAHTETPAPPWCGHIGVAPQAALRRAVEFIETHAHTDITLTDVAAAARVSARAVQDLFRRHYNTTPTAYLREVRLARAHQELTAADPTEGTTVSAIARRWVSSTWAASPPRTGRRTATPQLRP
ncbi:MAG TPA: helix-turn-helix domain-containing protein [Pseudonocardia sp.]|nr:helix-turn-helix domain-containing protein [Pseudonocardia sp.]